VAGPREAGKKKREKSTAAGGAPRNPPLAGLAPSKSAGSEAGKRHTMATSQVETVSTGADKAKLGAAVVLVIAALAGFYLLGREGQIAQWGALVVGLAAAFVVFMTAESGRQFAAFGRDSWKEVKKVVWPTRKEAVQMTMYVIGFCAVMALFLWLTDKTLEWAFYDLILGWKR
jgi:preprotein translocase subunit SecE